MGETIHDVNDIQICAQVDGPDDGTPLLLVMGLGAQRTSWDPAFVEALVAEGYRVVSFDNRDVGHSTHLHDAKADVMAAFGALASGDEIDAPYRLSDMAADAAGLLDVLGIDAAHVVGVSMGGMITQTLAIEHPDKVLSATSIMSTTGDRDVGQPSAEASAQLLAPPPATEEEAVSAALAAEKIWGSPAYLDPEATEARARREWNRVRDPKGIGRQLVGILASGSRSAELARLDVPFTVIHGTDDNLVGHSGGVRTAEVVPGARFVEFPGMGHNLPRALWPEIIAAIRSTTDAVPQPAD